MRSVKSLFVSAAVACAAFASAQASPRQDKSVPGKDAARAQAVKDLIASIEAKQQRIHNLRLTLEFRGSLPSNGGGKALELRALMRLESRRDGNAKVGWSRLDVDLDTPQGPLRTEKLRTPDGIRIHLASEFTGERWLRMDRSTMHRLDRAAEVFGSTGALQSAGGGRSGSVVGADLLRGLSRSYDLEVGKPMTLDDVRCIPVTATLTKPHDSKFDMPTQRPDKVLLYFAESDRLLRKMIQIQGGKTISTVTLRDVEIDPEIPKDRFVLRAPRGVRFTDILTDKMASVRIRMDLRRLDAWEAEQRKKKAPENASGRK